MAGRRAGSARKLTVNSVRRGLESSTSFDGEIVAAEAVDEEGRAVKRELGDDVLLDRGGGRGGKGDDGRGAERGEVLAERAVVGAKVVSPGGDAMRFIDSDERRFAAGEHLGKAGNAHALGRDEEELEVAVEVVAAGLAGVVAGEAGVDAGDARPAAAAWRPGRP